MDGLDHLLFLKHEVVLFQVLDPWERDLPLEGNVRFRDLETGETLTTLSEGVRDGYRAAVREWLADLDRECLLARHRPRRVDDRRPAGQGAVGLLVRGGVGM